MGGERAGERGGGDPNITGIMYLYEKILRGLEDQRGTLTMSSGFVAGVSRRDGGRCAKSCVEKKERKGVKSGEEKNKRDEWSASGSE